MTYFKNRFKNTVIYMQYTKCKYIYVNYKIINVFLIPYVPFSVNFSMICTVLKHEIYKPIPNFFPSFFLL